MEHNFLSHKLIHMSTLINMCIVGLANLKRRYFLGFPCWLWNTVINIHLHASLSLPWVLEVKQFDVYILWHFLHNSLKVVDMKSMS